MARNNRSDADRELTGANRAALAHVAARAERDAPLHLERIRVVLASAGRDVAPDALLEAIAEDGALTINFHPDRLVADGRTVADALRDQGTYRSQFETQISNGGLSAFPGGGRDSLERSLFAGAYHETGVHSAERPKYGGLNLMNYANGACPRFGSCHLRLRPAVTARATLCFGDSNAFDENNAFGESNAHPAQIGRIDRFAPILAPMLEAASSGAGVLGRNDIDLPTLVASLLAHDHLHARGCFAPTMAHGLNDYIEAQVHGPLELASDVDAVVIDEAFRDTREERSLAAAAAQHGFALEWHPGHCLALDDFPRRSPTSPRRR